MPEGGPNETDGAGEDAIDDWEGRDGGDGRDGGSDPGVAAVRDHVVGHVTRLVRDLRRAGVNVPANAGIEAGRALATVGLGDQHRARAALRATLVSRGEDLSTFDRLFPRFWERLRAELDPEREEPDPSLDREREATGDEDGAEREGSGGGGGEDSPGDPAGARDQEAGPGADERDWSADDAVGPRGDRAAPDPESDDSAAADEATPERSTVGFDETDTGDEDRYETSVYSQTGRLERVRVGALGDDDGLSEAVGTLTGAIAALSGRRWDRTPTGDRIDTRRALRRSFATGGTIVETPRRSRRTTGVRCTLLVDVSGSVLDTIDRGFLVRFVRAVFEECRSARAFFFDDSVREVTKQFASPSAAAAVRALGRAETKWGGGTRIGHAVEIVRREFPQAVDRRTTVFVVSDGLEVGETDELEAGMAWLARRANVVLWLNPLAASPGYEPTCRGMAVSLPYVDGLFAFTGPDDVAEMARQLHRHGAGGRVGYEFDPRYRRA